MIRAELHWQGDQAIAEVKALGWERLQRVVAFYWTAVTEALSVSNPRVPRTRTRTTKNGAKGSTYATYPTPSKPGEPPRKRTGWLQRNVLYELDEATLTAKVGITTNARYGLFLELGTRKMLARPFLLGTLK